jgi:TonB family protein
MMEFLVYDLKVAVLIAVFYMFYRLLLSRETFHRVNRVVLLATAVLSFVLPLCVITMHRTVVVSASAGAVSFDGLGAQVIDEPQTPLWQLAVIALFFVGLVATLGYTLQSVLRVWMLISRSEQHPQPDGTVVCVADGDVSPFSWMHYIVLSRSDYEADNASILAHERGHISQHHSLDLLLVDTLTALQWFNPAMWMLRQDLRAIHEYEADAAVLSQGINMRQYQYLLIQKAVSHCGYSVANGISHSTLKNRITMMLHKNSSRASLLKLLALVPIVGTALALQAETVNDYVYEDTQEQPQKKIVKKGKKAGQVKMNTTTIEVKEAKPEVTEAKAEATNKEEVAIGIWEPNEKQSPIIFTGEANSPEPLIVIDGKAATMQQLKALDPEEIDNLSVIKNEGALKEYAKHFNADTSNGIIFVNTKEYVKNGKKEIVSIHVTAKEPQEEEAEPKGVFDVVEQMPEFPGGAVEMMKFLSMNVKYPAEASSKGIEGRVLVKFVVEKDGSITEARVTKSVNELLDAEALRVINLMPKWKPGMQNGKPVRVFFTLPVTFRLS